MKQIIEKLNEKQQYERGQEIVRYQGFKTDIALSKMKVKMPSCVFNAGVSYLKRGIKTAPLSAKLKKVLDDCVANHIQPLTPSVSEKREFKKPIYQNKEAKPPVCNMAVTKKKLTAEFEWEFLWMIVLNCLIQK